MRLRLIATIIVAMIVVMAAVLVYGIRQKVEDFNSDDPKDPTKPVVPVTPPGTPPGAPLVAEPRPVAVGSFSPLKGTIQITKSVAKGGIIVHNFGASIVAPNIILNTYTGTAPPQYEWRQVNPAAISPTTVTVKWYIQMYVRAEFHSTKYTYGGSTLFEATWESSKWTSSFSWVENELGAKFDTHTWPSTGNIYYWEHGSYKVFARIFYEQYNGAVLVRSDNFVLWSKVFTV